MSNVIHSYGTGALGENAGPSGMSNSPRRTSGESISLLRTRNRSADYEEIGEIPEYDNSFPGIHQNNFWLSSADAFNYQDCSYKFQSLNITHN